MKTILKSIIITVLFVFSQQIVFSQINKSELVITEKGINLEDAKKNALSKAISQIYGVYVSSDINIQNEKIIKDEIIMSSFGNIDKSEILAKYLDTIKNEYFVTIKFSFSIDNFLEISKSKGIKLLIDGNELANQYIKDKELRTRNQKLLELNSSNEYAAMSNSIDELKQNQLKCYNYKIKNISDPERKGNNWAIPLEIKITINENFTKLQDDIFNLLRRNSIDPKLIEKEFYRNKIKIYGIAFCNSMNENDIFYFRNSETLSKFTELILNFNTSVQQFTIENGYKSTTVKNLFEKNNGNIEIFVGTFSIFLDLRNEKNYFGGSFFHNGIKATVSENQSTLAKLAGELDYDIDYTNPILNWNNLFQFKQNFLLNNNTYNLLKTKESFFYNFSFLKKDKYAIATLYCENIVVMSFYKITKKTEIIITANDILTEEEISRIKKYYINY